MATVDERFDWIGMHQHIVRCFYRIHAGWEEEHLEAAANAMTRWYWKNQQMAVLDRWRREGLQNICHVKRISNLRPLLFVHLNQGQAHEGSTVTVAITARMKDYLQRRDTGKLVEGSRLTKKVETLWTFRIEDGQWRVSNIEEGSLSTAYARMRKDLPKIESTIRKAPR